MSERAGASDPTPSSATPALGQNCRPDDGYPAHDALASVDHALALAARRTRAPGWYGMAWAVAFGALYWVNALPHTATLVGTLMICVVYLVLLLRLRRVKRVTANGFRQPRLLWMPACLAVVAVGAFLAIDVSMGPDGPAWAWVTMGAVVTVGGLVFFRAYENAFEREQARRT